MDDHKHEANLPKETSAKIVENEYDCKSNVPQSSKFSDAFSSMKKSELYEGVVENMKKPSEDKVNSTHILPKKQSKHCIVVSSRQRGNPLLKYIRNVPFEYGEIVPDYVMGAATCSLFLSLKYHTLNPNYIHDRMKLLGQQYSLRVLLVQVDVKDPVYDLKQLTKICVLADFTLMLAWSPEEAAGIIEVYKIFEHKPPDLIMERQESNPYSMIVDALTSIKSVNRTDAMTLLSTFGSLQNIINATEVDLSLCPGFGLQKAKRLYQSLHNKFEK